MRGPKPTGELNARGVRIDIRAASPFTSESVLAAIAGCPLDGARVVVQRYGEANRELCEALESRGASVQEIATYRWALPADLGPLERLVDALAREAVDAVVFTSAVQVKHLFAVADRMGRAAALPGCCAGSSSPRSGPYAPGLSRSVASRRRSRPIRRSSVRWSPG